MNGSTEELQVCEARLKTLLPETYQETYEDIKPVSMGSAGLLYDSEGNVAWDEIWGSFCDLAMAGGPPHRGMLLEPASLAEIEAQPKLYNGVVQELCRGIHLVAGLHAQASRLPGWIRVDCTSAAMADWLLRAITMENVAVRRDGLALGLPAGPMYRLEKEIKNVITVAAKSCHYWLEHMSVEQHDAIGDLLQTMRAEMPLLSPARAEDGVLAEAYAAHCLEIAAALAEASGLQMTEANSYGWLGVACPDVRSAVWMMRILVGCNVLSRRQGNTLLIPVSANHSGDDAALVERVTAAVGWARMRGVLNQSQCSAAD